MRSYEAGAEIDALAEGIWAVLVDGPGYTTWDSGIEKLEGAIASGSTISVYSEVAPGRAFPVEVVGYEPLKKMTWESRMPLGLFKGHRTLTVTPPGDRTRFHMREAFPGPLLPLIGRTIPDLQFTFHKYASGLKRQAESR